jgi:hypothetical protein
MAMLPKPATKQKLNPAQFRNKWINTKKPKPVKIFSVEEHKHTELTENQGAYVFDREYVFRTLQVLEFTNLL